MSDTKVKITVVMNPDEAERLKVAARASGLSTSEFARRVLNGSGEVHVGIQAAQHEAAQAIAEAAEEGRPVALPTPVPLLNGAMRTDGVPRQPATPTVRPAADYVPSHPCANLRPVYPAPYDKQTCQGSCADPRQKGRPCFWAAPAASQCPLFARKTQYQPQPAA